MKQINNLVTNKSYLALWVFASWLIGVLFLFIANAGQLISILQNRASLPPVEYIDVSKNIHSFFDLIPKTHGTSQVITFIIWAVVGSVMYLALATALTFKDAVKNDIDLITVYKLPKNASRGRMLLQVFGYWAWLLVTSFLSIGFITSSVIVGLPACKILFMQAFRQPSLPTAWFSSIASTLLLMSLILICIVLLKTLKKTFGYVLIR